MGARSAEALAKRAAKRNMTVEEYCKSEQGKGSNGDAASLDAKRQAAEDRQAAAAGAKRARADAPRPRHGDWTCTGCQFQNFASRDECKQCENDAPNKDERERVQAAKKVFEVTQQKIETNIAMLDGRDRAATVFVKNLQFRYMSFLRFEGAHTTVVGLFDKGRLSPVPRETS